MTGQDKLVADISRASAAFLFNVWGGLDDLPAAEKFERLERHFAAALAALLREIKQPALPEPSRN